MTNEPDSISETFNTLGGAIYRLLIPGDSRIEYRINALRGTTYTTIDAYNPDGRFGQEKDPFTAMGQHRDGNLLMNEEFEFGFLAEQELFNEIASALFALLTKSDTHVEYLISAVKSTSWEQVRVFGREGRFDSPNGKFYTPSYPLEISAKADELRAACYREGAGTWFSAKITVTLQGTASAEYNYDQEPWWDAPIDPVAYVHDQEAFPRELSAQPEWLRQRLAEGRARH